MLENKVRALTFFSLVTSIVSLIFVNRSFGPSLTAALLRPNPVLVLVLGGVVGMLSVTILASRLSSCRRRAVRAAASG